MVIKGIRTDCVTGEETEVELTYDFLKGEFGDYFQLHGGVTGFESFYIRGDVLQRMAGRGWIANMGTTGRCDKLEISAEEMNKVYQDYQYRMER